MKTTTKIGIGIVSTVAALGVIGGVAAGSVSIASSHAATARPAAASAPAPAPIKTIIKIKKVPARHHHPHQAPVAQAPASAPQFTNSVAVVDQFYQDITDHNYAAAWTLGGSNLSGGTGYDAWVAGYRTTVSIDLYNTSEWGSGQVHADLSALQSDGSVKTYAGAYHVSNGVITSADITQVS
jgi:hypothetical protein